MPKGRTSRARCHGSALRRVYSGRLTELLWSAGTVELRQHELIAARDAARANDDRATPCMSTLACWRYGMTIR